MVAYPFDVSWQRHAVQVGGSVFFVNSTSANKGNSPGQGDTPDRPFSTLAYALTQCTAAKGDVVYCMPGHSETVTTTLAMSKSGVQVVGLGRGRLRPNFTGSGAIATMTISAANCLIENLRFIGAAASVTYDVNVTAADTTITNCFFEQDVTPVTAIGLTSAHRTEISNCYFLGTANGPTMAIDFVAPKSNNWVIKDCFFNYHPNGLDSAVIRANDTGPGGGIILRCVAIGLDATCLFVDINSSVNVGEGMVVDCAFQANAAATVANLYDLGGFGTARFYVSDGPNRGALLHPATSAT